MEKQQKMALLIDAENVSKKYIKLIMDELSEYGIVTYKRVYGDFTNTSVLSWKTNVSEYAMTPVFQFNYTQGKNASDSAMVIDAMDILYSGKVDGFCLVTSDSDFTKLAIRLREAGMLVIGMGEQKTPSSLVAACETFKYLDLLYNDDSTKDDENLSSEMLAKEESVTEKVKNTDTYVQNGIPGKEMIVTEITAIVNSRADEAGWINLATVGGFLVKRVPGFDPRNYGYKKLKEFVESFNCFETQEIANPKNSILTIVYIKLKENLE